LTALSAEALMNAKSLASLTFESGSKLARMEMAALYCCSSLKSFCVPASVEVICYACFGCSSRLSSLTFESGSELRELGRNVFGDCLSLKSIFLPASLSIITYKCFHGCSIEHIQVD
jgi:hypothetical protein